MIGLRSSYYNAFLVFVRCSVTLLSYAPFINDLMDVLHDSCIIAMPAAGRNSKTPLIALDITVCINEAR